MTAISHVKGAGLMCLLAFATLSVAPAQSQPAQTAKQAARAVSDASERAAPRYNTECNRKAKAGTYACKYPGNLYGVSAYTNKKNPKREDILALDRQVFMRSAQLAIENDREYFTMTGEGASDTYQKGKTIYVRGTAGYSTPTQCGVVPGTGVRYCYPGQDVAGTPGYSYEKRGVAGRNGLVKIWKTEEKELIDAGKLYRVVDSDLFDAEKTYEQYIGQTPGRWPSLIDLYESRAKRFEAIAKAGGAQAHDANITVMRTYLRLATAYAIADREADATAAVAKSVQFLNAARGK